MYEQTDWNCNLCDRTTNKKSKRKHLKSLTHYELEKSLRINHFIQNPNFFDIISILIEYVTDHDRNLT